jgi:hypothetical protein
MGRIIALENRKTWPKDDLTFRLAIMELIPMVLCLAKVLRLWAGLERRFPFTFKFSKMGFQWAQSALWWNKL